MKTTYKFNLIKNKDFNTVSYIFFHFYLFCCLKRFSCSLSKKGPLDCNGILILLQKIVFEQPHMLEKIFYFSYFITKYFFLL